MIYLLVLCKRLHAWCTKSLLLMLSGLKIWCVMRLTYLCRHGFYLLSRFFLHIEENHVSFLLRFCWFSTLLYWMINMEAITWLCSWNLFFFLAWMERVPLQKILGDRLDTTHFLFAIFPWTRAYLTFMSWLSYSSSQKSSTSTSLQSWTYQDPRTSMWPALDIREANTTSRIFCTHWCCGCCSCAASC